LLDAALSQFSHPPGLIFVLILIRTSPFPPPTFLLRASLHLPPGFIRPILALLVASYIVDPISVSPSSCRYPLENVTFCLSAFPPSTFSPQLKPPFFPLNSLPFKTEQKEFLVLFANVFSSRSRFVAPRPSSPSMDPLSTLILSSRKTICSPLPPTPSQPSPPHHPSVFFFSLSMARF